ncbi:MAG: aminotransferase class I/II-fold pyridoxal phosphate-dependent enzyme [Colwellia sp.]|nr:aminotransferase class I/II-fold pyridoxal phosphate-dependent enzyme [Colwellia sp.]
MNESTTRLIHGGQLNEIAELYSIPLKKWLDLSTGISPISYPIPNIPENIWQQLPQTSDGLIEAAKRYYCTENINATSGSQAVIARLPNLYLNYTNKSPSQIDVWLPEVGYKEHERSWCDAGFNIKHYNDLPSCEDLTLYSIVVVINPNNPTGELHQQRTLTDLLKKIEALSGWLVVDEAFMDVIQPNQSIIHLTENKHLFVLRSVGKFFGLAGIRIGFLSANQYWLEKLKAMASPWEVNGPAQFITEQALNNHQWQSRQQQTLITLSTQLEELLTTTFLKPFNKGEGIKISISGCGLFKTLIHPQATELFQSFCRQGLYVRLCDENNALRFGIPNPKQYKILAKLLAQHCHS